MILSERGVLGTRLATATALIAGLLGALFFLPSVWLMALIALIVGAAALEWGRLCRMESKFILVYAALAALLFALLAWTGSARPAMVLGAAFWALVAPFWLWHGVERRHSWFLAAAGLVVLVPTGVAMVALAPLQVLLTLCLTWVADSAAYFAGRRFGRRKLAPAISPSKTWEGVAGGLLGTLAYAIICAGLVPALRGDSGRFWGLYLAAVMLLCAASIVGDLFESAAKRQASVKDSGMILPGHGGILDRIDSATSTLPLAALLWPLVNGK